MRTAAWSIHVAVSVSKGGVREVPGLWIADAKDAKFWLLMTT
jgi:transposase-like protein